MTFDSFLGKLESQILSPLITVLALGAFILFAYGVFEMIRKGGSDEGRKVGRQHVIWGLVGLVILFGATTIVSIIGKVAQSVGSL